MRNIVEVAIAKGEGNRADDLATIQVANAKAGILFIQVVIPVILFKKIVRSIFNVDRKKLS